MAIYKRHLTIVIGLIGHLLTMQAAIPMTISVTGDGGTFMRGTIIDKELSSSPIPILGGEVSIDWTLLGHSAWNYPSLGVAVGAHNLGNSVSMGQAITAYGFMRIPFFRVKHFEMGIRPGVGIACVTKWYGNTVPKDKHYTPGAIKLDGVNGAIGSCANAYLTAALYMSFPIQDGWALALAGGWHHISNASIMQPNTGYNTIMGQVGVQYTLFDARETMHHHPLRWPYSPQKQWGVEIWGTGGLRQAYFADNKFYGIATAGVSVHWRACEIFKLGIGGDFFYDGYYTEVTVGENRTSRFSKTYLTTSDKNNCYRVGISLQPEFVIGRFMAGIHIGVYMLDPIKNYEPYSTAAERGDLHRGIFYSYDILEGGRIQDGWLYTRFVMKYRVSKHIFAQLGLKTHGPKAEFMDAGLGVCF